MFRFVLSCALCALRVSPAAGEILVQEGDYYPRLIGHEPIRITGGRIDELVVGGFQTTIEGGSFGRIHDMGDTPFLFRTANYTLEQPIQFDGIPRAMFEGFHFVRVASRFNQVMVGGL